MTKTFPEPSNLYKIQAPVAVDVTPELPPQAVTEAIVNAVVHRSYTSNGSVQVMLFKDRLEVWNPGKLPPGMTIAKLNKEHTSNPVNPVLANPVYLAGYIEQMGTGTTDIIDHCPPSRRMFSVAADL